MSYFDRIRKPALIIDEQKCRSSIRKMSEKAERSAVIFRPHFKTHQSATIGEWFRSEGADRITVSSASMASFFASSGWNDITIAFPANIREMSFLKEIAGKVKLNILTSGREHFKAILEKGTVKAGCYVKVDTGYNRSGTDYRDRDAITSLVNDIRASDDLSFSGFLTHAGHTYAAKSADEIRTIWRETVERMQVVRSYNGSHESLISVGDTPACSIIDTFSGVDEIRPGNFVFYDLTQVYLGSCRRDEVALAVACPVADRNLARKELIIYGGGVHLSKESLVLPDGRRVYGLAVLLTEKGWHFPDEDSFVKSLSQEHGIVSASDSLMRQVRPGDLLGIIPVHSCMTADLLRRYHTTGGEVISDFSPK